MENRRKGHSKAGNAGLRDLSMGTWAQQSGEEAEDFSQVAGTHFLLLPAPRDRPEGSREALGKALPVTLSDGQGNLTRMASIKVFSRTLFPHVPSVTRCRDLWRISL
jgi:hypothetical protein